MATEMEKLYKKYKRLKQKEKEELEKKKIKQEIFRMEHKGLMGVGRIVEKAGEKTVGFLKKTGKKLADNDRKLQEERLKRESLTSSNINKDEMFKQNMKDYQKIRKKRESLFMEEKSIFDPDLMDMLP